MFRFQAFHGTAAQKPHQNAAVQAGHLDSFQWENAKLQAWVTLAGTCFLPPNIRFEAKGFSTSIWQVISYFHGLLWLALFARPLAHSREEASQGAGQGSAVTWTSLDPTGPAMAGPQPNFYKSWPRIRALSHAPPGLCHDRTGLSKESLSQAGVGPSETNGLSGRKSLDGSFGKGEAGKVCYISFSPDIVYDFSLTFLSHISNFLLYTSQHLIN